jgi:hypothetical protein
MMRPSLYFGISSIGFGLNLAQDWDETKRSHS